LFAMPDTISPHARWKLWLLATMATGLVLLGASLAISTARRQTIVDGLTSRGAAAVSTTAPPAWLPSWIAKGQTAFFGAPIQMVVGPTATSADMQNLAALTNLTTLVLSRKQTTDAELAALPGLTRLRHLELSGTQITDAGLVHLAALTRLERLGLYQTRITDAGVRQLSALKNLQELDLSHTHVTRATVVELMVALPGCQVIGP
jgi:hypothetical protein